MDTKKNEMYVALNKFQSILTFVKKDKINPFYKNAYCDLAGVFEAIREPLFENGLSVTQTMDVIENNRMVIRTKLMHISGESIESTMLLPDISDPQKIGSAITYYRRYALMSITGLPASDDDGNGASSSQKQDDRINTQTLEQIERFVDGREDVEKQILKFCGIKKLADMKEKQVKPTEKFITAYLAKENNNENT